MLWEHGASTSAIPLTAIAKKVTVKVKRTTLHFGAKKTLSSRNTEVKVEQKERETSGCRFLRLRRWTILSELCSHMVSCVFRKSKKTSTSFVHKAVILHRMFPVYVSVYDLGNWKGISLEIRSAYLRLALPYDIKCDLSV